jgi:hypothetical protein
MRRGESNAHRHPGHRDLHHDLPTDTRHSMTLHLRDARGDDTASRNQNSDGRNCDDLCFEKCDDLYVQKWGNHLKEFKCHRN